MTAAINEPDREPARPENNVKNKVSAINCKAIKLLEEPIERIVPISLILSRTFITKVLFTITNPAKSTISIPTLKIKRIQYKYKAVFPAALLQETASKFHSNFLKFLLSARITESGFSPGQTFPIIKFQ